MKAEKVMINGKGYYHYRHCEKIMANLCMRCCFLKERDGGGHRCALPFKCEPDGYYIRYNEKPIEIGNAKFVIDVPPPPEPDKADKEQEEKATAQQQLTERNKEGKPGIGKRIYYGFPNGVEAEDICRYLSFNLGNVVKYSCRAGRKDPTKRIEDLEKAKDYLEDEIKRAKEELGNEIHWMKEKSRKRTRPDAWRKMMIEQSILWGISLVVLIASLAVTIGLFMGKDDD